MPKSPIIDYANPHNDHVAPFRVTRKWIVGILLFLLICLIVFDNSVVSVGRGRKNGDFVINVVDDQHKPVANAAVSVFFARSQDIRTFGVIPGAISTMLTDGSGMARGSGNLIVRITGGILHGYGHPWPEYCVVVDAPGFRREIVPIPEIASIRYHWFLFFEDSLVFTRSIQLQKSPSSSPTM
jgi:hypothetical protein